MMNDDSKNIMPTASPDPSLTAERSGDGRPPVGRFAPSPTGRMHLGNVYAALMSWLSVKKQGGRWLLRIEDIDPQRSRKQWEELIMDDLLWLGMEWDAGPGRDDGHGPYRQSERGEIYLTMLERLNDLALLYPCHCTRADIMATQAPHESDGRVIYRGTCRPTDIATVHDEVAHIIHGHATTAASLRMIARGTVTFCDLHYGRQTVTLQRECGDFIVRRRDGAWAYQLSCVVDDALMGVSEVVRGRDLLLSAPQQIYTARCLGFAAPRFAHVPLLLNGAGQRLSKRDQSLDMAVLRQRFTPHELLGHLASLAGIIPSPRPVTLNELLQAFRWESVSSHDVVVRDV